MPRFTKRDAEAIARKLNAEVRVGRRHDLVQVYDGDRRVATYGISRSSRVDTGCDYLPGQLHLTSGECEELRSCTLSTEEYLRRLRERGIV
jgi:hypothetical protein